MTNTKRNLDFITERLRESCLAVKHFYQNEKKYHFDKENTACAEPLGESGSRCCPYPAFKKEILSVREKKTRLAPSL